MSNTAWAGQKDVARSQLTPNSPSKVTVREKAVSLDLGILRLTLEDNGCSKLSNKFKEMFSLKRGLRHEMVVFN